MTCTDCKAENIVPDAPSEDTGPGVGIVDADSAILAYVFEEKQETRTGPPTPPPLPPPVPPGDEPKPQSQVVYWATVLSIFGLIAGLGVYLALFIDWRGPDPRLEQAEELGQRSIQVKIQANNKGSESGSIRVRATGLWNQTNQSFDAIVLASGERDDKQLDLREINSLLAAHQGDEAAPFERKKTGIQDALTATETRLTELRKQARESLALAVSSEVDSVVAANDAKRLNLESEFYAKQERELRSDVAVRPDIRVPAALEMFGTEKNRVPLDESFTLTSDWTENFFQQFGFPEADTEHFFAALDSSRKFVGEKSLRITSLTTQPITILFPEHRNAQTDLSEAKFFNFSLRFPDATETIATGTTLDVGKIGGMSVRFGNAAGFVELQTLSPRYCEALFFDGRGRFVPIEFPLAGNQFWGRTESIDMTKFERSGDAEPTFFSRIDWVELRFFPRSDRTTLWIDGITATDRQSREPYDLLRAERTQEEQRKREAERFRNRRPTAPNTP